MWFSTFLVSLSDYWCIQMPLISEYWLCILLLCQIHLLGQVVFWGSLYFYVQYQSSANNDRLTSSFPIWMSFISSSCPIPVSRTSSTMLNKSGEGSRCPCLPPGLKGITFSFCVLSMMLAVGFSYMAFIMLRYVPSAPTLLSVLFLNHGCCVLANAFSSSIDMIMWFVLRFVYVMYHIYWFVNIISS